MVKGLAYSVGDLGSIPGPGRYSEEGNGNPLQYSYSGNSLDRGAWRTTVHEITKELNTNNLAANQQLKRGKKTLEQISTEALW